jgi:hypothetical protein
MLRLFKSEVLEEEIKHCMELSLEWNLEPVLWLQVFQRQNSQSMKTAWKTNFKKKKAN